MARILLVNLSSLPMPGNEPIFPIGVRCVEDALAAAGHEVHLLDFVQQPSAVEDSGWAHEGWDVIGFAIRNIDPIDLACSSHVGDYQAFIESVRAAFDSDTAPLFVGGGPGFSLYAATLTKLFQLDVGVCGPGEEVMVDIANDPRAYRGRNAVIDGRAHAGFVERQLQHSVELAGAYADGLNAMIGVETRRKTCFQKCVYCPYAHITGDNSGDNKPIDLLRAEIESIWKAGFRRIFFTDSIFNAHPRAAKAVVKMLADASFEGLSWSAYFAPRPFDDEFAELLTRTHVESVVVSPDSLDPEVMRALGKNFKLSTMEKFLTRCRRHGLRARVNLVFGGPGETRETVATSARFANEMLDDDELSMHIGYRILPQTALAAQTQLDEEALLYPTFFPFHDDLMRWVVESLDGRFLTPRVMMNLLAGRAAARRMSRIAPVGPRQTAGGNFGYVALSRGRN